jgi:hypothetical protein
VQPGNPATFEMVAVKQEVGRGDMLIPATRPQHISYVPHRPQQPIAAKVISIYGGINDAGRNSVIALNKGLADGIEIGHVLAVFKAERTVRTRNENDEKELVRLPEERAGLIFVFRTYERVAYALVMETSRPITRLDSVRNP